MMFQRGRSALSAAARLLFRRCRTDNPSSFTRCPLVLPSRPTNGSQDKITVSNTFPNDLGTDRCRSGIRRPQPTLRRSNVARRAPIVEFVDPRVILELRRAILTHFAEV